MGDAGARGVRRPLVGLATVLAVLGIIAVSIALFNGTFTKTVPVTVMADRAGLLMNRGAKVKLNGAPIGTVSAIQEIPGGRAELTLAIDPDRLAMVPANVTVGIGANTVFGAKSVELVPPPDPSPTALQAGSVLDAQHVTVEVNNIFDDLTEVLAAIDPAKLNETLAAVSSAFSGRGGHLGQSLSDFNDFLGTVEPSLPTLGHELQTLPNVATAYADSAPDLMALLRNASALSRTLVDERSNLDRFLVSSIGLADAGNDVIGGNSAQLSELMRLLVPTTDLTAEYHEAITCALEGITDFVLKPPSPVPGVYDLGALTLGIERYRYPGDLPKVAATGGPRCEGQLPLHFNTYPPKVIADVGTDPTRYGNQELLLNTDGLKQWLFGPIDGPPRNTVQWGQPG